MIRLKRNNLSEETKNLLIDISSNRKGITIYPPVLAKGSEASVGLKDAVEKAKRKFRYGNLS